MRSFLVTAMALALPLTACGTKGSGGQGIGFASEPQQVRAVSSKALGVRLGRLYLPSDRRGAYVELLNTSETPIDLSTHALQLQSHVQRIDVSLEGEWQPGEARRVEGDVLTPLHLHQQAGELLLLRDGSAVEAYGSWGAHPSDWPTGYGVLATRLGISSATAYPLPLHLGPTLAVDLASDESELFCLPARGPRRNENIACDADPAALAPAIHLAVEGDGETIHLELPADEVVDEVDVFGMRLCTHRGCQTLMQDEPIRAPSESDAPYAMHMGVRAKPSAFGARAPVTFVTNEEWIELVAPGDEPKTVETRLLGHIEPRVDEDR